jgi:nucleotidyltransferase substrate binding protein (TIGR01987 family)
LDFTALEKATGQLKTAIEYSLSSLAKTDSKIFEQFRNSVVQCFEYTYELCVKSIRRYLESTIDTPSIVDDWEFKDLIREAAVRGIISQPERWFEFRRLRNVSSHAYDAAKAEEVYLSSSKLLTEATDLIQILKNRKARKSP